ncbi:hypothetical protein QBC40DRAFT_275774 [Triangularia verruculosa]|uniref:RING-type domain-containing protein n=1 Tax=Triangularia verruculosa TaxID=2587418 RepID=A0AAN6XM20_9PEZI|nr:hypothetical protein QBC40DRAFT_275774 [Triangularia verruculosa]
MGFPDLMGSSPAGRGARKGNKLPAKGAALQATSTPRSSRDASEHVFPEYIAEEKHIQPLGEEPPDLRELNACLDALAAVFPDIQIEVFRELLANFDGESRLALAADALLKNRATWVKGRWRIEKKGSADNMGAEAHGQRLQPNDREANRRFERVPPKEVFRNPEYKAAVETLGLQEFKGLSRSTIKAVLAESNYSYLEARETLVGLASKSWSFTISSFFRGRKVVSAAIATQHPLIIYKSTGQGSIVPTIKATGSAELDRELYDALILPLKKKQQAEREANDHELAVAINNAEAEETDNLLECVCCYTESVFEEFTSCNANGHMICFRCVQHTLTEAIFGQGWQRSIDPNTGTLRCLAAESPECTGNIPSHHLHRALMEDKTGPEKLLKLDQRLADNVLAATGLPLIHCPFCSYAEIDDIYEPKTETQLRPNSINIWNIILVAVCLFAVPFLAPLALLATCAIGLLLVYHQTFSASVTAEFRAARQRQRRRRRGLRFTCQNPLCGRASCLLCNKAWKDVHICNESSLVALRTQVEQAMSLAIKRVCPKCNTGFVKTSGCNKLTCPCGYRMCYVCRKDIGDSALAQDAGYQHFCQHFRPQGDGTKCKECSKCNLWEKEDEEAVLEAARKEAERKWMEVEKRDLSAPEKTYLTEGVAVNGTRTGVVMLGDLLKRGRWPTMGEVCDVLVEQFLIA